MTNLEDELCLNETDRRQSYNHLYERLKPMEERLRMTEENNEKLQNIQREIDCHGKHRTETSPEEQKTKNRRLVYIGLYSYNIVELIIMLFLHFATFSYTSLIHVFSHCVISNNYWLNSVQTLFHVFYL